VATTFVAAANLKELAGEEVDFKAWRARTWGNERFGFGGESGTPKYCDEISTKFITKDFLGFFLCESNI
jgi:hypothetical protein